MIPEGIGRYQPAARRVFKPLVSRLWDFTIEGLENVPRSGPAVLCPNHIAAIDSLFVPSALERSLIYVGKSEYLDDWKTRKLFPALGMIPIDRRGGDHANAALDAARQVLQRGGLFGIYPEGTRSRSGKLHKGHTGAARLAVETGAPIVPVGLVGTGEVQPVDSPMPKFFKPVTVRFGRPIEVGRYMHRIGDRTVYRELIDEVMYEIRQLTGLEYSHTYAGSKAASPEPASADSVGAESVTTRSGAAGDTVIGQPSVPTIDRASSVTVLTAQKPRPLSELLATSS